MVDAAPPRHRRFSAAASEHFSKVLSAGGDRLLAHLDATWPLPVDEAELVVWAGGPGPATALFAAVSAQVVRRSSGQKSWMWTVSGWRRAGERLIEAIASSQKANPECCWRSADALRLSVWPTMPTEVADDLVAAAVAGGALLRRGSLITAPATIPSFPPALLGEARRLLAAYRQAGLQPPYDIPLCTAGTDPKRAERALNALRERGWLLQLNDRQHFHRQCGVDLIAEVVAHCQHQASADGTVDVLHGLKERHGLTRKHSFPLCDWLDAMEVTRRVGTLRALAGHRDLVIPQLGESLE